jgi:hypothetical protein
MIRWATQQGCLSIFTFWSHQTQSRKVCVHALHLAVYSVILYSKYSIIWHSYDCSIIAVLNAQYTLHYSIVYYGVYALLHCITSYEVRGSVCTRTCATSCRIAYHCLHILRGIHDCIFFNANTCTLLLLVCTRTVAAGQDASSLLGVWHTVYSI